MTPAHRQALEAFRAVIELAAGNGTPYDSATTIAAARHALSLLAASPAETPPEDADLVARWERLRLHFADRGLCRVLSLGRDCACPLCDLDALRRAAAPAAARDTAPPAEPRGSLAVAWEKTKALPTQDDRVRVALEALRDRWRKEASEYPVATDVRAALAAVAVRLCADELDALLAASPAETPPLDANRCAVCGWPLDPDEKMCRRGNCSMRPLPTHLYDPARALIECAPYAPDAWKIQAAARDTAPPAEPEPNRSGQFNAMTGAFTWGGRPASEHPDRCICQGDDWTPHKHYADGSRACARCGCEQYRPVVAAPPPAEATPYDTGSTRVLRPPYDTGSRAEAAPSPADEFNLRTGTVVQHNGLPVRLLATIRVEPLPAVSASPAIEDTKEHP